MLICFAFNGVFPARAGEFARAYLIGRSNKIGFGTAFGTVVAERLLDSLTLLPLLMLALWIAPIPESTRLAVTVFGKERVLSGTQFVALERNVIYVAILLLIGIFLLVIPRTRGWILAVARTVPGLPRGLREKIENLVHQFAEGVNFFRNPWRLAALFVLSFFVWATAAASVMVTAWGFPNMPMNFVQAFAATVIVCIFIIPAAPGYWGFFEAGIIFSVVIMGIHPNDPIVRSYAILLHLTQWLPIVAVGLPWAWAAHVSLSDVRQVAKK
jgi:hypothetical protein